MNIKGVSRASVTGLIIIVLIIETVGILHAVRSVGRPFSGFKINPRLVVSSAGPRHWTGTIAGLKFPDKVIMANDKPLASLKDLDEVISSTRIGEAVTYTIERGNQTVVIPIPIMRFGWIDLLMDSGIAFLCGLVFLCLGIVVFILKPDTEVSWTFLLACIFFSVADIIGFDISSVLFRRIYSFATIFMPAAFVHLSMYFPDTKRFIQRHRHLQWIPYILSAILFILVESSYMGPLFSKIQIFIFAYILVGAIAMVVSTLHAFFQKSSALARQRARVVLFGSALAFPIPAAGFLFILFLGGAAGWIEIPTDLLVIPTLFFPASVAYSIARHNLFDVDVYIKRAVGYVIMTLIVGMAYLAVQTAMSAVILKPVLGAGAEKLYPVIFALLVVFFFNPLNRTIQGWVDRIFYRKKFDYKETIVSVSNALASVLDLNEVINQIIHTVRKEMFVDAAGVILLEPKKRACQTFFVDDRLDKTGTPDSLTEHERDVSIGYDDPLLTLLSKEKKLITRYDIEENPHYSGLREACGYRFSQMGASLALPLIYQNDLRGVLALGTKKSGHFYTREDIDLLTTLASHGAVAIENARLFRENLDKGRMEEELKIAHDIQMSMLPDKAPETEGIEIAGKSIPAKEVGGDFYDFIETGGDAGPKRLGIVIGDVTGKGVSGALMMAASRSICRVLADEHSSVAELMTVGNNRLNKDIRKGMFVALIYALFDPADKTLTLSNAGQTQPIMCPGDKTKPFFIDTEGDRFPLGIIKDSQYEETRLTVNKGDTIVFYTDGVVEAMNGKGEMYGFERLMASIDEGRRLSAGKLLENLMQDISLYTGDVEQHDDITIVVVKAE